MGTLVNGKLESGIISKGDPLILMPNKVCQLSTVYEQCTCVLGVGFGGDFAISRLFGDITYQNPSLAYGHVT